MPAQFLHHTISPLPAKTPLGQIPTPDEQSREEKKRDDAQPNPGSSSRKRAPIIGLQISRRQFGRFQKRHSLHCYERQLRFQASANATDPSATLG